MDTPRDLSKPLRTALIACICLTLIALPVAGAIYTDDFEDGDASGWDLEGSAGVVQSSFEDTYSLEVTGASGDSVRWSDAGTFSNSDMSVTGVVFTYTSNWGSNANAQSFGFYDDSADTTNANNRFYIGVDNGQWHFHERVGGTLLKDDSIKSAPAETWVAYNISIYDGAYHVRTWDPSNTEPDTWDYTANVGGDITGAYYWGTGNSDWNIDEVTINDDLDSQALSGKVTDGESSDPIPKATVEIVNSTSGATVDTTETNDVGDYSARIGPGDYDVTASKDGYRNQTKSVTISGSDETVDFQLESLEAAIELDTRSYLEHGQSAPYTVVVDNGTGRADVTDSSNLTVVSNDTAVVTVDTTANEIVATSDISVNNRTYITATYNDPDGTTYTATQNVTVANKTVENLKILPTGPRLSASLGANADEDPTANTIPVIIVAMILGAGVTLFARSFAGLMAATLVITLGWIGGMVGNGMIIVTIMTAIMIGLNVATNVDYSVRR